MNSDNVTRIATRTIETLRAWDATRAEAEKVLKDAEQPRPHDLSEYDLDHSDGLRFWEGFVIGLACGIAVYAVLIRVFV